MNVLMVGTTGTNAGLVLSELVKRGVTVRALVRDERQAELARRLGATGAVIADSADPASLRAAVARVDGVFNINPAFAPREAEMGLAVVDAAKAVGVRKFVFSGVIHPSISAMDSHARKQPVEEALYASGMEFTVLQPAMSMQNLQALWPEVLEQGRLSLPYSASAKACWVDYRDVAEVAALAMTGDDLGYGTFELCAGMVDPIQMATMISEELGRPIDAEETPLQQWASQLPAGPVRDGLTRMMAHYDQHGFAGGNALVLRAILGREPRSLKQYFHELATRPS